MTVTWTSGYGIEEAVSIVEWGLQGAKRTTSPAATLTFDRGTMCGECEFFPSPVHMHRLIHACSWLKALCMAKHPHSYCLEVGTHSNFKELRYMQPCSLQYHLLHKI